MVALIDMSADLDIYLYNFTTQGIGWNIPHTLLADRHPASAQGVETHFTQGSFILRKNACHNVITHRLFINYDRGSKLGPVLIAGDTILPIQAETFPTMPPICLFPLKLNIQMFHNQS